MVSRRSPGDPFSMQTTTPRIALIPVAARSKAEQPVVRRYRLGRVVENLGPALAGQAATPSRGERAP
jgi:hypothetical protein